MTGKHNYLEVVLGFDLSHTGVLGFWFKNKVIGVIKLVGYSIFVPLIFQKKFPELDEYFDVCGS